MKLYELNYLISPSIAEDEQKALAERLISLLEIQPLRQETVGFLTTVEFYSEPAKLEDIEKKLKAEPTIKRFMIVKKPKIHAQLKPKRTLNTLNALPQTDKKAEKPKVELKEIDKKLDEILK